jgi:hypothetical protein
VLDVHIILIIICCQSSFRRFEGIKFLHIQGDNMVQTEAEVVAKKEFVDCVKRL